MGLGISMIFDQFGHPNQPFWTNLYRNLAALEDLDIKVFAKNSYQNPAPHNFFELKSRNRTQKLFSLPNAYFRNSDKIPIQIFVKYPHLSLDQNEIVHILNAQQYPELSTILKNKKLIISFRGFETLVRPGYDLKWKKELINIFQRANRLHFVSDYIKNAAIALGAEPQKCFVIRRSVDTDFFNPGLFTSEMKRPNQICSIGRLIWQKGYIYGLEALALLKKEGISFNYKIIGEGIDFEALNFHVKRLDLIDEVEFMGNRSRIEIREILSQSVLYFHPSVSEALPNSVLEASAMELPIIASSAGGIEEAVSEGENGLLCNLANTQALFDKLNVFFSQSDQFQNFGIKSRELMLKKFNTQRETQEWKNLYLKL